MLATRFGFVLLLAVAFLVTGCGSDDTVVTGEVVTEAHRPVPDDAVLTVKLEDASLQDVAAKTISTQTIEMNGDQLPVPYELPYDEAEIDDRNTYTVSARIESGGTLIYISGTFTPVRTNGQTEDVPLTVG